MWIKAIFLRDVAATSFSYLRFKVDTTCAAVNTIIRPLRFTKRVAHRGTTIITWAGIH